MADVSRANSKLPTKDKSKQKEDEYPFEKKPANGQQADKKSATAPVVDNKKGKKAEEKLEPPKKEVKGFRNRQI
ncbi:unnamed protein product [Cyprideis torosa]|uniref:Uncharacterized protein n=1 Tax=Cyprideis torosa TaxID=163714 RepID=A0A7R8WNI7_9CRUS|nr:unnamed protein product [Cyprideis torosa]CAG0906255.1 unnamed protein product [Cyprideis torosa]